MVPVILNVYFFASAKMLNEVTLNDEYNDRNKVNLVLYTYAILYILEISR